MYDTLTINGTKSNISYNVKDYPYEEEVIIQATRYMDEAYYPIFNLVYNKKTKETTLDFLPEMNTTSMGIFALLYNRALDILSAHEQY